MYTISKGPSKIVQKTRRGLTQKLETVEVLQDLTFKPSTLRKMNIKAGANNEAKLGSKGGISSNQNLPPTFSSAPTSRRYHQRSSLEKVTPQQEEIVKYVNAKWSNVQKELQTGQAKESKANITYYQELEPNPSLRNFEPFDLESWWGKKLYNNLTKGT